MTNQDGAIEPTKDPETTAALSPREARKTTKTSRKPKGNPQEGDERVSVTFSLSQGFAKRLRMAVSASSESASDYVERNLAKQVKADLRKAIEGLVE